MRAPKRQRTFQTILLHAIARPPKQKSSAMAGRSAPPKKSSGPSGCPKFLHAICQPASLAAFGAQRLVTTIFTERLLSLVSQGEAPKPVKQRAWLYPGAGLKSKARTIIAITTAKKSLA